MGDISIFNGVINQKQSPALYQGNFANRPTANFLGRMFTSVDTGQIFVDTGSTWVLVADAGVGGGTLSSVCVNGNTTATGIVITAGGLNTNAITNTSNTAGSVLFAGTGGIESQSNSTFFWDNTNKRLGIGNAAPGAPLDVHGTGTQIQINGTGSNNSFIQFQNAGVSKWREGNLYNAGSNDFQIYNNSLAAAAMTLTGSNSNATFTGTLTASSLIKSGGTSTQFLKADGSVDSSAYITLASLSATSPLIYNNLTGAFTIQVANGSQSGYLSSTDWTTFNNKASLESFSASTPLSYNSGTGAFSIQVANSGQSGYLTSTDWNTFNNKQSTITTGNLTETTSSVLTISGGTGAVIGSGTTIAVKQSSSIQSGYLSSTDWNTFNNKAAALNGTGFVKASGTVISYDNSTYYLASNPSNYITLTSLAATSPLVYNNLSGGFSITQATTSTNGYLSSTDWNTFNNKQSALTNPITGTGVANQVSIFNGTTSIIGASNLTFDNTNARMGVNASSFTLTAQVTSYSTTQSNQFKAAGTAPGYTFSDATNSVTYGGAIGGATAANNFITGSAAGDICITNQSFTAGAIIFGIGTTERFRISSTGAATFSSTILAGQGTFQSTGANIISKNTTTSQSNFIRFDNSSGGARFYLGYETTGSDFYFDNSENGNSIFITNSVERMRITSAGNVLIGTTTDSGYKLQVNGSVSIVGNVDYGSTRSYNGGASKSVSTTATTIQTTDQYGGGNSGNLTIVSGIVTGNGGIAFVDLVLWMYGGGTPTVISSQTTGAVASRTYSISGSANLQLAMGSSTYFVSSNNFRQSYTN